MPLFRLSRKATRDVAEIISYLHREVSASAATKVEDHLFATFNQLVRLSALGHRRTDLTSKDVLFHGAPPYFIVFRRTKTTVLIAHVIHGSRDLKRLLGS